MRVCQDVKIGKLLIQTDPRSGEPQLHYCKLPYNVHKYKVLLMVCTCFLDGWQVLMTHSFLYCIVGCYCWYRCGQLDGYSRIEGSRCSGGEHYFPHVPCSPCWSTRFVPCIPKNQNCNIYGGSSAVS